VFRQDLPARPPALPSFEVAITPPDLSPWRAGNGGIPGVMSFDSGLPGPHAALTALMHGNEIAGAITLDALLRAGIRPARGRLSFIFLNLAAFDRFDATDPTRSRCVDEDMNRIWSPEALRGVGTSCELERARTLLPALSQVDMLLDLHTMPWPGDPVVLSGRTARGRTLARALALPALIVADEGHENGRRLIDWHPFSDTQGTARACLVEGGQHWTSEAVAFSRRAADDFLWASCGIADMAPPRAAAQAPPREALVTDTITARCSNFFFSRPWRSGQKIPRGGTLIGRDGGDEIRTPYDDCVLVMPNLKPGQGHTAVRLAWERPPLPRPASQA
jgi:predicted deacylase